MSSISLLLGNLIPTQNSSKLVNILHPVVGCYLQRSSSGVPLAIDKSSQLQEKPHELEDSKLIYSLDIIYVFNFLVIGKPDSKTKFIKIGQYPAAGSWLPPSPLCVTNCSPCCTKGKAMENPASSWPSCSYLRHYRER